jgi:hypothetical protein
MVDVTNLDPLAMARQDPQPEPAPVVEEPPAPLPPPPLPPSRRRAAPVPNSPGRWNVTEEGSTMTIAVTAPTAEAAIEVARHIQPEG